MKSLIFKKTFGFVIVFLISTFTAVSQNAYTRLCLEAIAFEKDGKLDEAAESYSEAIKLKPDDWTGYNYRAKVNLERGRYDDAIADASKALSLSPNTASLYEVRARGYEAKEMYDRAIDDYSKALPAAGSKDKSNFLTWYRRGRAYFMNRQYREAIYDFDKAAAASPEHWNAEPDIYLQRAQSNIELGNFSGATGDLDRFLTLRPDDIRALFHLGYAYFKN